MTKDFILYTIKRADGLYIELFDLAEWCIHRGVAQADFFRSLASLRRSGLVVARVFEGKTYYKINEQKSESV